MECQAPSNVKGDYYMINIVTILSQNQLGHESDHYKFTKSFKYYFIVPTGHLHINFISKSSILMKTVVLLKIVVSVDLFLIYIYLYFTCLSACIQYTSKR